MLSLKNIMLKDSNHGTLNFSDTVLRHFPDPNDRTPNDPLYFVSSDAVVKFANYLAQKHDIESVSSTSTLTCAHMLLLRDYAISVGWDDIYLAGKQLVLEAKFDCGHVNMKGTWHTRTDTVRLTVDLSRVESLDLTRNLWESIPTQYGIPDVLTITGLSYAFSGQWLCGDRTPIPFERDPEHNPRMVFAKVYAPNLTMVFDLERGTLLVGRPNGVETSDAPDLHCFDVTYVANIPTSLDN